MTPAIQLGLGLIGIGRRWGYKNQELPTRSEIDALLSAALDLGVRFFDTAPAYGASERVLGDFLKSIPAPQLDEFVIATKFGEHWDSVEEASYTDHTYDSLCRSLDGSLELLPRIDLLQLHKAQPEVLRSADVRKAFSYAR